MDNAIDFPNTFPLDSDYLVVSAIQHLNNQSTKKNIIKPLRETNVGVAQA